MNKNSISFRSIEDRDKSFLCRVYTSTRLEELAATGWGDDHIREFLASQFEYQHKYYQQNYTGANFFIIRQDGRNIGRLYREVFSDEIRIIDIALLPAFRNNGIGTRLIRDILGEAAAKELVVRIHVEKNNPALTLYNRLGFEEIKDVGVYWLMEWTPVAKEQS